MNEEDKRFIIDTVYSIIHNNISSANSTIEIEINKLFKKSNVNTDNYNSYALLVDKLSFTIDKYLLNLVKELNSIILNHD